MKYLVCEMRKEEGEEISYHTCELGLESTRAAEKWVRENGKDNVSYAVLKLCKTLEVKTVSVKKVSQIGS